MILTSDEIADQAARVILATPEEELLRYSTPGAVGLLLHWARYRVDPDYIAMVCEKEGARWNKHPKSG